MSRIVRSQFFSIVESLQHTHRVLAEIIENDKKDEMIGLLTECQEEAITIGSLIEKVYDEKSQIIHELERYCEMVYDISQNVEKITVCKEYNALALQQLEKIRERIEQEIPDKLEIAFFPYKVSMWDGMESIYLEALKDGNCDTYCVPVPYYTVGQNGELGGVHDESGRYPKEIYITDWKEYDFEIRKPDIIFFHNPFDDWQTDEYVESRFYAASLRKYTKMLVYMPYISWKDVKAGGKESIEKWKRSCFLPGTIQADKIIVESEDMRMACISEYKKRAEEQGIIVDMEALQDKIIALGFPKYDRLQKLHIPDSVMPKEWERKIAKPNGGKKKIILYYVGINNLLAEGERLLDKMEAVFSVMKKSQNEIILWWKPQVQIGRMLKKMRPELWNRYEDIEKKYKSEAWGIYDDTNERTKTVLAMIADGYYGDWSTWVWEFQENQKPVMIQNVNTLNSSNDKSSKYQMLSFADAWRNENELWVSNRAFNGIFKIDILSGKGKFIRKFDGETAYRRLHKKVMSYYEWLIFISEEADNIAFFSKKTHEIEYVNLWDGDEKKSKIKIGGVCIYKKELWLFPLYWSQNIMIVNLYDRCVRYDNILKETVGKAIKSAKGIFWGKALFRENEVWIPIRKTPEIIRYNMDLQKAEFIRLGTSKARINSMDVSGDTFLFTFCDKTEIMEWNPKIGKEESYSIEIEWEKGKCPFIGIIPVSDTQYIILPSYGDYLILRTGNECRKLNYPSGFCRLYEETEDASAEYAYQQEEGRIFIFLSWGNMFLEYDMVTEELEGKICKVPEGWNSEKILKEYIYPYYLQQELVEHKEAYEEQADDLAEFLDWIETTYEEKRLVTHSGEKIYHYLIDEKSKRRQSSDN